MIGQELEAQHKEILFQVRMHALLSGNVLSMMPKVISCKKYEKNILRCFNELIRWEEMKYMGEHNYIGDERIC